MPRKSKKQTESSAPGVPAYVVTFSDMVTLLLTFFVMLLSLAQVRDAELFNRSRDAFREYINCYGLGMLMGKKIVPELGQLKSRFDVPDPDENVAERSVDTNEETLRRLFNKVSESMDSTVSRVKISASDFTVTGIRFPEGRVQLDSDARAYLKQFAAEILSESAGGRFELYILGLAADESNLKRQLSISSLRAQSVAKFLEDSGLQCPIYSWGAGSGGNWIGESSPISENSHIFIAIRKGTAVP